MLARGGCIAQHLVEDITYDDLYASETNVWTVLYLTGYLTKASRSVCEESGITPAGDEECLVVPNKEIRTIYTENFLSWILDTFKARDRRDLFDAFWKGDAETLSSLVSDLLMEVMSCRDYHENYYHGLMVGLFTGLRIPASSNDESGEGLPDITVKDTKNRRYAVVEVKRALSASAMAKKAEEALGQIRMRKYDAPMQGTRGTIIHWGCAFFRKECLARCRVVAPGGKED